MQTSQPYVARPPRPPLRRALEDRQVAGVGAGLAAHLGLHVNSVRAAFVLAALLGGAGIVVYAFLWAFVPEDETAVETVRRDQPGERAHRHPPVRLPDGAILLVVGGLAVVGLGVALLLQLWGWNLRLDLTVPLLVIGCGAAFAWSQLDAATRRRWVPQEGPARRATLVRMAGGVALAVGGLVVLTNQHRGLGEMWNSLLATLVVLAGVSVLAAPWGVRLWRDLRAEQAERIRATERADIAAHLHDSVLQTLALIQRRADDPVQVGRLARAQERELRSWLYAEPTGPADTLASAVTQVAHEVEDLHGVPVELIVTGDQPLEEHGRALVAAVREALVNAVRHGAPPVSAYLEVGPTEVAAFVRDHGAGFEPDAVPADRLGVRESILGRMDRHRGTARVRRLDPGTEVQLTLPRPAPLGPEGADPTGPYDLPRAEPSRPHDIPRAEPSRPHDLPRADPGGSR